MSGSDPHWQLKHEREQEAENTRKLAEEGQAQFQNRIAEQKQAAYWERHRRYAPGSQVPGPWFWHPGRVLMTLTIVLVASFFIFGRNIHDPVFIVIAVMDGAAALLYLVALGVAAFFRTKLGKGLAMLLAAGALSWFSWWVVYVWLERVR